MVLWQLETSWGRRQIVRKSKWPVYPSRWRIFSTSQWKCAYRFFYVSQVSYKWCCGSVIHTKVYRWGGWKNYLTFCGCCVHTWKQNSHCLIVRCKLDYCLSLCLFGLTITGKKVFERSCRIFCYAARLCYATNHIWFHMICVFHLYLIMKERIEKHTASQWRG